MTRILALSWLMASAGAAEPFAPDRVIVQFDTSRVARAAIPSWMELREFKHVALARRARGGLGATAPDLAGPVLCRVPDGATVTALVALLSERSDVIYAEPDYIGAGGADPPDDPDFDRQWHHRNTNVVAGVVPADIRTLAAWDITTGSSNVTVAVLDTGLVTNHPEFVGRAVPGYDFVNNDADPYDDHYHGTTVAGVLAQNANNTNRGAGVDLQCRIMPVKVLNASNLGYYSDWASGIAFAVSNGAKVVNLSAGGSTASATLSNAIMAAINAGVLFVTITHNDASGTVRFPGRMAACITAGGTASNDARYTASNWGTGIDLVAPALHVRTVGRTNHIFVGSGTSYAAPQVAGVCSLLASLYPDITQDQARNLLCAGADDQVGPPGEDTAGYDLYFGWGRLNARATLDLATASFLDIGQSAGDVMVTFSAPTNASARQPFVVETAARPDGTWVTSALVSISYSLTSGVAEVSGPPESLFHRLRVRSLTP